MGTAVAVGCMATVVLALAAMQYRWNQEASDATGVRLADALQLSMVNWHLDLFRNLYEIALTMKMPTNGGTKDDYAERLQAWRSLARYPQLVANVYVVRKAETGRFHVSQTTPPVAELPPARWPAVVERIVRHFDGAPSRATVSPPSPDRQLAESFYNIGAALRAWQFDAAAPALVQVTRPGAEWLLVELEEEVLWHRILPDLAQRYFQGTDGLDYEVAVVAGDTARRVIYTSDPGFGNDEVRDADGRMDVFGRATGGSESTIRVFHRGSANRGPTAAVGVSWFPLLGDSPIQDDWQLIVRHRRGGPLGSFVANMRQRGLAVSFAALLLLVLSLSMLVVTTLRAQKLARLQMDFVTAVSHELRTPLTIIESAADNIATGVIDAPERMREYGTVIGHEVGRLSGLVERILRFAAARDGRQTYLLEPLSAAEMVDTVLSGTAGLIRAAQFTVERDVAPDLPPVVGDRIAATQCLENLVTNALKYGKEARWMRVQARIAAVESGGPGAVEISVSDRGMGIGPEDLTHIFEPFYRSVAAHVAQIHGTGLGLAVAKQMAEALGGSLSVQSALGKGSIFTLRLRTYVPGPVE